MIHILLFVIIIIVIIIIIIIIIVMIIIILIIIMMINTTLIIIIYIAEIPTPLRLNTSKPWFQRCLPYYQNHGFWTVFMIWTVDGIDVLSEYPIASQQTSDEFRLFPLRSDNQNTIRWAKRQFFFESYIILILLFWYIW